MKADTTVNWTTAGNNGFIPLKNEAIFYTDTGGIKIGDGETKVHELPAFIKDPSHIIKIEETVETIGLASLKVGDFVESVQFTGDWPTGGRPSDAREEIYAQVVFEDGSAITQVFSENWTVLGYVKDISGDLYIGFTDNVVAAATNYGTGTITP
jgi:hypothetical protein